MSDKLIVHVDSGVVEEGILDHQVDECPTCKGPLETSYGMAGGGLGVYGFCDRCQRIIWKCEDRDV